MKTIDEMNEFDRDIILLHRKSVSEDTPQAILVKVKQIRNAIADEKAGKEDPIEKEFTLECYDEAIRKLRDLSVADYQLWLRQNKDLEGFEF
ncbi:hypothetical protein [Lacticaseibacillus paracasei]|jgi:hypothetical protein|uniref:hypothetical protein n=1 Tax=Lacticaseibacillus paracasei TaxID=1597 RepID=UPI00029846DA|nr:hypothetical protein [Lacticaseibacillus paracasei]EKQ03797.1 hypothetical protein LCA211_3027 [Lacticaseibacillus casei 21/1]EKP97015.1 hypothetical protein LCA32G_1308 [Lacticaseibacillus paracasei]EKQ12768.1 hypothetical protein LCAM36_0130 [Lacticaseibacillus paracasei]QTH70058.1 hypothetical protein J3H89_002973 [Lacticaseibacillus paracasei]RKW76326.1 hypothetical protein D9C00_15845 [Lacticaseibacillus paracasei]